MDDYWLLEKAEVQERPFVSATPLIGPFITWFVRQWHLHVTQRYVRPFVDQQNQYNRLLAQALHDHDTRLIMQDRRQTELTRQMAELTSQVKQMNHLLTDLNERLAQLDTSNQ
jgi:hypothetical protein